MAAERAADLELIALESSGAEDTGRLKRVLALYEEPVLGTLGVVAFLALWEWAGRSSEMGKLFFSAPSQVWATFLRLAAEGQLWSDAWVSMQEFLLGFGASVLVGIPLGVAMGWYRRVNALFDPLMTAFYATPRIALFPLLIIWFGIGITSKIAVVFLGAVFPVLMNTIAGVKNLDPALVKAARAFGANDWQIFRTVALPGSVPFILAGVRLAVGRALIGIVVAELFAATAGIGFMMQNAAARFQTDKVMVGILMICFLGVASMVLLTRLERRFEAWRPERVEG